MPQFRTELFGQIIYDPEISYEDLLPLEEELTGLLTARLKEFRGRFITFESEGDRTYFQCLFQEFGEGMLAEINKALTAFTGGKSGHGGRIECKLLFVDKELSAVYFYALNKDKPLRRKVELPAAGPIDNALSEGRGY